MPYQQNIPQPTDVKSQSQAAILGNFQALVTWGNGYGEFTAQGVVPAFTAGNDGVYTLNNATTTKNELYVHKQTQAGTIDIPFTASAMSNVATAGCINGWTYLPSGLLMKWGQLAVSANGVSNVLYNATSGGPAFTQVFRAQISPYQSAGSAPTFTCLLAGSLNGTQFNVVSANASASTGVSYLVLGV